MVEDKRNIIAIDFDGTITKWSPYPQIGEIRPEAIEYIKQLKKDGYKLVLWTCRQDHFLLEAINLLAQYDLLNCFDLINSDGIKESKGRKIIAAFYIDDRAMLGEIRWTDVYYHIKQNIAVRRK